MVDEQVKDEFYNFIEVGESYQAAEGHHDDFLVSQLTDEFNESKNSEDSDNLKT